MPVVSDKRHRTSHTATQRYQRLQGLTISTSADVEIHDIVINHMREQQSTCNDLSDMMTGISLEEASKEDHDETIIYDYYTLADAAYSSDPTATSPHLSSLNTAAPLVLTVDENGTYIPVEQDTYEADSDQVPDGEDEDSNGEGYWANDYPDEDDVEQFRSDVEYEDQDQDGYGGSTASEDGYYWTILTVCFK